MVCSVYIVLVMPPRRPENPLLVLNREIKPVNSFLITQSILYTTQVLGKGLNSGPFGSLPYVIFDDFHSCLAHNGYGAWSSVALFMHVTSCFLSLSIGRVQSTPIKASRVLFFFFGSTRFEPLFHVGLLGKIPSTRSFGYV